MARKTAASNPYRAVPDRRAEGTQSQSAITAQIIGDAVHQNNLLHSADRAVTFRQLLDEICLNPNAIENDVLSNYKLIAVVAEAGLDVLSKDDPFCVTDELIAQGIASLHVIELAIQQTPQVLLSVGPDTDGSGSQMCLWLFPKLFQALVSHEQCNLRQAVQRLLYASFTYVFRTPDRWGDAELLLRFYKSCTEDIMAGIFALPSPVTPAMPLRITVPSQESREIITQDSHHQIASRRVSSIFVSSLKNCYILVTGLLITAVSDKTVESSSYMEKMSKMLRFDMWSVHLFARVWQHLMTSLEARTSLSAAADVLVVFLQSLSEFQAGLKPHKTNSIVLFNFVQICLKCVAYLFQRTSLLDVNHEVQHQLVLTISTFLELSQRHPVILRTMKEVLMPQVSSILTTDSKLAQISLELQVTMRKISNYAPVDKDFITSNEETKIQAENSMYTDDSERRPSKRRRQSSLSSPGGNSDPLVQLESELCLLFGDLSHQKLDLLHQTASSIFPTLSDEDRRKSLNLLMQLPCIKFAQTGEIAPPNDQLSNDEGNKMCGGKHLGSVLSRDDEHWTYQARILLKLKQTEELLLSKEGRVQAMIAVKRLHFHTHRASMFDLRTSNLGKWCLQSLRSSLRELRVVAGQTLPMFLRQNIYSSDEILRNNRIIALDFLKSLSELHDPRYSETTILALGETARVCGDAEMNLILLQLIDFLGDSNPMISSAAHLELAHLGQVTAASMDEFFKPFWRTIGPHFIKDLLSNPQKAQQISDLLGIGVSQLLDQTKSDTVPFLVLLKRNDILQRVAIACNDASTPWSICMNHEITCLILSFVLIQRPEDAENHFFELLRHVNPKFRFELLPELLKLNPILVACELLKASRDGDAVSRTKAIKAIHTFTGLVATPRPPITRGSSTQSLITTSFLESHALGIMASFSDGIDNLRKTSTAIERRRCLGGLEALIELAGDAINVALPQIKACLRSALDDSDIRYDAFSCWATLLKTLESEDDLDGLIDHYFSAVVQNWQDLTSIMQQNAHDTIADLIKKHNTLIRKKIMTIPSLASIPLLVKFESELQRLREQFHIDYRFQAFAQRCQDESATICLQGLRELLPMLEEFQGLFHASAVSEQPEPFVAGMTRTLLDACVKFGEHSTEITDLCARGLGIIGCLDPNRIESIRDEPQIMVLSNFEEAGEAVEFITFMLQNVLIKAFHSVSNPRAQSFLAYVMQELLKFCGFKKDTAFLYRVQSSQQDETYMRWMKMPERVRTTLTPLLTSRYVLTTHNKKKSNEQSYPIFSLSSTHAAWLRSFVSDLLCKAKGDNAQMIFTVLGRIVRSNDLSVANFLLPFAVANVIIGGTETENQEIIQEFLAVLGASNEGINHFEHETVKLCSQNVFECLDYLSRWLQMKRKEVTNAAHSAAKPGMILSEIEEITTIAQIRSVEKTISSIPADVIARRAVECKSYARALFHWEQYIREKRLDKTKSHKIEPLYQRLQDIYSQIDEPDGIEGIASQLQVLDSGQQILEHENAGRWSAAQSWYELQLQKEPNNEHLQTSLLTCLKNSGQFDLVVNQAKFLAVEGFREANAISIITEAAWFANRWDELQTLFLDGKMPTTATFNTSVGAVIMAMKQHNPEKAAQIITECRASIVRTLSTSSTASLQSCHEQLLKLHALYELELLTDLRSDRKIDLEKCEGILRLRLDVLGSFLPEKQYLLGIRRGAMSFSKFKYDKSRFASSWMTTAELARKGNSTHIAFNAVLQASNLGDESAKIEYARLLWKEGQHRKAIQSLEGAISANAFKSNNIIVLDESDINTPAVKDLSQNLLTARAHLLLAKWLDSAGQTQSHIINNKYQVATSSFARWEKGQYYLGRYYNKLLESEKALAPGKQGHSYLCGETAKLVVEIYLRSLTFGSKYLFQTLPKLLTLWLDLGDIVATPISEDVPEDIRKHAMENRPKMLATINRQMQKHIEKIPTYIFYTALAQMITRITHSHSKVWSVLESIILKVVSAFPQQSLWSLLAVAKSTAKDRASRGITLLCKLKDKGKSIRYEGISVELRSLVTQGQRLSEGLLYACEVNIEGRSANVSLSKTLGFNPKLAPCPLAIPLEKTLSASLPTSTSMPNVTANLKQHRAFPLPRDTVTISSISDDVLVLFSLQKPRKITVRGSDGEKYGLLCKPKDDLRIDQRLMEFNAMINRALKKDADASKRRLYIKTYAVTPLNEQCGLIEWVDGLKPLRDILLTLYRQKGIKPDFNSTRNLLAEACAAPENHAIFTEKVLPLYPPVLHEYFAELFPEPSAWFAARLRYTRSCAVASMVGYVLGLGDRHGENVLLEQSSGGIFHVDFNCLFEKGLTFEKPELVPFRLTHNMVDAFGVYGVEGPWRRCAELAFRCMRGTEDALLTILETFVYDPTADFMGSEDKKKRKRVVGVPQTPREVLESVKGKVGGLLRGESVPLSVEGVVDALIRQATDPGNLAGMYIGWCAFL